MLEFSYLVYQLKAEGVPHSTECARFSSYENIHLKLDLEEPLGLLYVILLIPARVFIESLTKTFMLLNFSSWKKKRIVVSFSNGHKGGLPQEIQRGFR